MAIVNESKLRSRLGYLAYNDIQDRIDNGQLDEYDLVIVKDQDTVAYIDPNMTIHNITSRLDVYVSESTAKRALNSSSTTYVGMPVGIYYQGSYKLYLVDGVAGDWNVLPAWGNPVNFSYNELVDVPLINKVGTVDDVIILNQLADGMYAVNGIFKVTDSSESIINTSPELVIVKEGGNVVTRITGKDTLTYDTTSGEPTVDKVATEQYLIDNGYTTDTKVNEMIDEQFSERLEETSSESIQDLFD